MTTNIKALVQPFSPFPLVLHRSWGEADSTHFRSPEIRAEGIVHRPNIMNEYAFPSRY